MPGLAIRVIGLQRRRLKQVVEALKVLFEPLVDKQECSDGSPSVIVAPGDDCIYATLNFRSIFGHDGSPLVNPHGAVAFRQFHVGKKAIHNQARASHGSRCFVDRAGRSTVGGDRRGIA